MARAIRRDAVTLESLANSHGSRSRIVRVVRWVAESDLSRLLAEIPSLLSKSSTLIIDGTGLPHDRHGEAWVLQFVDAVGSFLRENKQSHRVVSLVVAAPAWVWSDDGADRLWKASGFLVHETARAVERHMRTTSKIQDYRD